jgi:hypothetical protein
MGKITITTFDSLLLYQGTQIQIYYYVQADFDYNETFDTSSYAISDT